MAPATASLAEHLRLRTLLQAAAAEKKTPVRAAISNGSARVSQNGWETEWRRQNNPLIRRRGNAALQENSQWL